MKVSECIHLVDTIKPNQYALEDKLRWLTFIERTIIEEVLRTHRGCLYDAEFTGYTEADMDKELIAKEPYSDLYVAFCQMKIDEENAETGRYNNSATFFNSHYDNFKKAYHREHMPIMTANIYL